MQAACSLPDREEIATRDLGQAVARFRVFPDVAVLPRCFPSRFLGKQRLYNYLIHQREIALRRALRRFTPVSDRKADIAGGPLGATRRHSHRSKKEALFDHLVGAGEYCRRDFEAQCFGSLEVNHRLEFSWRLHRQIAWLLSL